MSELLSSNSNPQEPFLERRSALEVRPIRSSSVGVPALKAIPAAPPRSYRLSDHQAGASLRSLFKSIRKHRWAIGIFVATVTAVTAFVTFRISPLYESRVSIKVEKRGTSGFIGQQASMPSGSDSDQLLATQLELIQSDAVLRPIALHYNLLEREKQFKGLNAEERARKLGAPVKLRRLKVIRVPNTYILNITYRASDPQLAANVANSIAQSYIAHAFDARDRSYDQVAVVVDRQLADLRQKMSNSADALARFERELNVVDPTQHVNMLTNRLQQLSTDYTAAQAERLKKEAVLSSAQSGSLAAAEASDHGDALDRMIERLNGARQQFAIIRTTFGENHPEYKKALNQVRELETQVRDLQRNTLERVEADYRQALSREQMSHSLVMDTKGEVDRLAARSYAYQQLKSESENYKRLYDDLQRITREQEINRSFQDAVIQVSDPARPAAKHVSPSLPLNLTLAVLLSLLCGLGGSILFDTFDSRLSTADDVATQLQMNVIGSIPHARMLGSLNLTEETNLPLLPNTSLAQATNLLQFQDSIRLLRNTIDLSDHGRSCRSFLVTSGVAGEGKSSIAAHLAASFAALGRKVLLVDADLRRPSLHRLFNQDNSSGLADVLAQSCSWKESLIKPTHQALFLMPAGRILDNSADLIHTELVGILRDAVDDFDLVIIDGPPLLGIPESLGLAASVDGVLLVARAGSATLPLIGEASEELLKARANVLGVVMNSVKPSSLTRSRTYDRTSLIRVA